MYEDNPFFEKREEKRTTGGLIVDLLQSVVVALFICIVLYLFIITPNQVDGYSMCPNFEDGQLLLTNKISEWFGGTPVGKSLGLDYQKGDVVVFQKPETDIYHSTKPLIKRIIATAGDKVIVKGGKVYVNGEQLAETYLPAGRRTDAGSFITEGGELTVSEGSYIVMGDNRGNSLDSRYTEVGEIKREWIQGKVILRYWPPSSFAVIGTGADTPGSYCPNEIQR